MISTFFGRFFGNICIPKFFLLVGSFFFFYSFATCGVLTRASLDTALRNIYAKVRSDDSLEKIPTTFFAGDTYKLISKTVRNNVTKNDLEALEATVGYLNKTYDCDLTTADVGIMLRQNKAIRPYLAALLKFPSPEDASLFYDVFYTSCLKLAACWNLTKQQSMTTEVLDQCIIKTTEAYFLVKPSLANIATMHQTTYGDNVFIDGNEENAPFDLMVDVERIGQVLFKDSKSRPEMVFFDLPDVSTKPSSQQSQNQTKPTQSDGERLENDISGQSPVTVKLTSRQRGPGTYTLVASARSKGFTIVSYQFWRRNISDSIGSTSEGDEGEWLYIDTQGKPYIDSLIVTGRREVRVIATDEIGQTGEARTKLTGQSPSSLVTGGGENILIKHPSDVQELITQSAQSAENTFHQGSKLGNPCVKPFTPSSVPTVPPALVIPTLQQVYTDLLIQQQQRLQGGEHPMVDTEQGRTQGEERNQRTQREWVCGDGGQSPDVGVRIETRSLGENSYEITVRTTARSGLLSGYIVYKNGQPYTSGVFPLTQTTTGRSGQTNASFMLTMTVSSETTLEVKVFDHRMKQGCSSATLWYDKQACKQTCSKETDPWAQELCEVSCCIKTCNQTYDPKNEAGILKKGAALSDKMICISKCLCGEISGPRPDGPLSGILQSERAPQFQYRLTFCRIPVKMQSIIPKKVASIEEVLDEISLIIKNLKESGQLLKHVKTKEMFEISLKKIKLADMLSFTMFVKFKPVFTSLTDTAVQQEIQDKNKKLEKMLRDVGSLTTNQERSKYVLLYNPTKHNATKEVATDYVMELNNLTRAQEKLARGFADPARLIEINKEKLRAVYGDAFVAFVQQNISFWNEVVETLINTNEVAEALKVKIEKAPD